MPRAHLLTALLAFGAANAQQTVDPTPSSVVTAISHEYPNQMLMGVLPTHQAPPSDDASNLINCPDSGRYSVTADFDGNGTEDYAVMLTAKQDATTDYPVTRVVIISGSPDRYAKPVELTTLQPKAGPRGWYLVAINESKLYNFETNGWVALSAPALGLIRCGGGSNRWFWNGKAFEYAGGM